MLGSLVYIGLDVAFNVILWILVKTTGSMYNGVGYAYHYLSDVEESNKSSKNGKIIRTTTKNLNTGIITVDNNLNSSSNSIESITNSLSENDLKLILKRLNSQDKLLKELINREGYYKH